MLLSLPYSVTLCCYSFLLRDVAVIRTTLCKSQVITFNSFQLKVLFQIFYEVTRAVKSLEKRKMNDQIAFNRFLLFSLDKQEELHILILI